MRKLIARILAEMLRTAVVLVCDLNEAGGVQYG